MTTKTYRLPNKKKWLLTDEFLLDFKNELDSVFDISEEFKATYWNMYTWLESRTGFNDALETVSRKHNVYKAIYEYAKGLGYDYGDHFDSELVELMVKKGIIEEGSQNEVIDKY